MITVERLREVLAYDPETGVFTWKVTNSNRAPAGTRAGRVATHGYRRIRIDGTEYAEHRLAWLYMTGNWPEPETDHRDGDPANNRWSNLREATRSQNTANRRLAADRTLPKGVSRSANGKRFVAQFVHQRVVRYLGTFDTASDAHAAYMFAARDHHGEFARAR